MNPERYVPGVEDLYENSGTLIHDYELGKTIGKGGFSTVLLAIHLPTFQKVAIKVYHKSTTPLTYLPFISQEIRVLKDLHHPHCAQLREVILTPFSTYLVLEYGVKGTVFRLIKTLGPRKEEEARKLFREVTSAVVYCHERGIAHRDIKPENVVLTADGTAKLTDFGFASTEKTSLEKIGTKAYMAPECFEDQPYDCLRADVWGLGVFLYFILTGKRLILKPNQPQNLQLVRSVSPLAKVLISRMLSVNPDLRPSAAEVFASSWVTEGFEVSLE